jgi:hypothetical protein
MSDTIVQPNVTHHALLVAWGQFAQHVGLVEAIEGVEIRQKQRTHAPQTKVLEFLVALLAGLPYLQDISRDAHPLARDRAVAHAWGQVDWADYSGVSRCLSALTSAEVTCIEQVLKQISQPILRHEIGLALQQKGYLTYDIDLTGRPVSNTSTSFPGATHGYMGDGLHLGYQAALASMHSPTYGRMWLWVAHHPGNTTSCTQAEAMILAAERATGIRPLRRTDLLRGRIAELQAVLRQGEECEQKRQRKYVKVEERLQELCQQVDALQQEVQYLETDDQILSKPERSHSRLARARTRLTHCQERQSRQEQQVASSERYLQRKQAHLHQWREQLALLKTRLAQFERDNADGATPVRVTLRLDAGFGTWENIALLIEMGYDIYTKPYNQRVASSLRRQLESLTGWTQLRHDCEILAAASVQHTTFPYPLDVLVKRTHKNQTVAHSTFLHYGQDRVIDDVPSWLTHYNGRQTIEAGIKEGKNVFQMHHLKVRSLPALALQECFATFAANFVRWAARWLVNSCHEQPDAWVDETLSSTKTMVQVGAHTSAEVVWFPTGCLLRFSDQSIYAGHVLKAGNCSFQLSLLLYQNSVFAKF